MSGSVKIFNRRLELEYDHDELDEYFILFNHNITSLDGPHGFYLKNFDFYLKKTKNQHKENRLLNHD